MEVHDAATKSRALEGLQWRNLSDFAQPSISQTCWITVLFPQQHSMEHSREMHASTVETFPHPWLVVPNQPLPPSPEWHRPSRQLTLCLGSSSKVRPCPSQGVEERPRNQRLADCLGLAHCLDWPNGPLIGNQGTARTSWDLPAQHPGQRHHLASRHRPASRPKL